MNSTPLPIVLGLLGAGLIGALSAHLATPSPAAQEPGVIAPDTATASSAQLDELASQVESLSKRLQMLEMSTDSGARQAIGTPEMVMDDGQLEAAVTAALKGQTGELTGVKDLVATTLNQIRAQEETQQELEQQQRREEALQRRVDRLTEELGLYPDQASQMLTALATEEQKRNEMRDAMRSGTADFTTIRDDMRNLRDETTTVISGFLSADQLEKYNESNSFGGFGGGRGGGGRGGGN